MPASPARNVSNPSRIRSPLKIQFPSNHQLYDYRLALELFTIERVASTGVSDELVAVTRAKWQPLLGIRADAPVDGTELVRADEAFHLSFARELGNPYIIEALEDINDRLRFVRLVVITTPHRVQATAGEKPLPDPIPPKDPVSFQ